jgi:hypothetical protein
VDSVETARHLWRQKPQIGLVLALALATALLVGYRVSLNPFGVHKRSLEVGAASSQILVDTPGSTLVSGASAEQFDALAARARVYGEYLSTLHARSRIAALSGVPERSITTSGPFSPESGQVSYENQTSASRAGELLKEGAGNRLVFTAQEGVPIITVDAQAANGETAIRLAHASFIALREYVRSLQATREEHPTKGQGVVVRQLGVPEGGMIGGSNDKMLMGLAFFTVIGLGCALIVAGPRVRQRWRSLDEADHQEPARPEPEEAGNTGLKPVPAGRKREPVKGAAANGKTKQRLLDDERADAPPERAAAPK